MNFKEYTFLNITKKSMTNIWKYIIKAKVQQIKHNHGNLRKWLEKC